MLSTVGCLLPAIFFIVAGVFGLLTFIARYRWNDKQKTQLFAAVAMMGTVALILWALIYL
jgi:predicted permease